MKKSILLMAVGGLAAALLCSCSTTYSYTSRSAAVAQAAISSKAMGAEVTADFSKRVTATSDPQLLQSAAIQNALFKCIKDNNIDVVVDPIYQIRYDMFKKNPYTVTVMGYAGKLTQVEIKTGIDAFVEKGYTKEEIEKYKLLTDPEFLKYYYQKDPASIEGGDVTNYFIGTDGSRPVVNSVPAAPAPKASAPASPVVLQNTSNMKPMVTSYKYRKSKQLRDAGISLTVIGGVCIGAIFPSLLCTGQSQELSIGFCASGTALVLAGVPMLSVGQVRMNKMEKAAEFAVGATQNGMGMKVTF